MCLAAQQYGSAPRSASIPPFSDLSFMYLTSLKNEWPFFALAERNEISVYLLSRSDRGRFIGSTSFTISPESAVNQDDRSNLDEINGL